MRRARLAFEERVTALALRGLTLEERPRLRRAAPHSAKIDNRKAAARLKVWRSWFDREDMASKGWNNFLAQKNLTETQLVALESLSWSKRKLPSWTTTLDRICRYLERASFQSKAKLSVAENLAAAVAEFAWRELSGVANMQLLTRRAAVTLKKSLIRRLTRTAEQAVNWEVSVADSARRVASDLGREGQLQRYFFSAGVTTESLRLLENHPALARLWVVQVEFWIRFVQEFLERAAGFARRVEILNAEGVSIISSLDVDLGDLHEDNRSVLRVSFGKGAPWFYKPRPGWQERGWFQLLNWINRQGFPFPFRILEVVCKDRHCWMEGVRTRPCRNEEEMAQFCFRAGALICLVHLLRGVDFHPENLVAASSQPVLVDCETLLHPATLLPDYARAEDESIRRTGMLVFVKRMGSEFLGRYENADRFLEELIAGFLAMHELLRRDSASRYLRRWSDNLRKFPARNIYRPTAHYRTMLNQSLTPLLLTSGLERSLYLQACCHGGLKSLRREEMEVTALQNADVPVFRSRPRRIDFDLSEKTRKQSLAEIRSAYHGHQVHR